MGKIEAKKQEKYNKILDSAYELFQKNEALMVSIDDIVKGAGVAKGTFYLYFKDKYDLTSKLIVKKVSAYMLEIQESINNLEGDAEIEKHIGDYVDLTADFLQKNITLAALIDRNVHTYVNTVIENREGYLKTIYDKLLNAVMLRGMNEQEAKAKMYLLIDMTISSCCNAILRGYPLALSEVKRNLSDIIASSIIGINSDKETVRTEEKE